MQRLSCQSRTQFVHKGQAEKSKKISRLWVITLSLLVLSIVSQFIVSNVLALKGQEVVKAADRATKLARQNQEIRESLSAHMSMTEIASQAQTEGMVQATNLKYFDLSQPVAVLPQ